MLCFPFIGVTNQTLFYVDLKTLLANREQQNLARNFTNYEEQSALNRHTTKSFLEVCRALLRKAEKYRAWTCLVAVQNFRAIHNRMKQIRCGCMKYDDSCNK
jgi:hypothetical protein